MTLVKYNNGYSPLGFGSFFDKFFEDSEFGKENKGLAFVPKVDIAETDKAFELSLALPGLKKEQIKLDLKEGQLTISGERKFEEQQEGKNFKTVETSYGTFKRSFWLPDNIAEDSIEAKFENGLLEIVIPKDEKKVETKEITIS